MRLWQGKFAILETMVNIKKKEETKNSSQETIKPLVSCVKDFSSTWIELRSFHSLFIIYVDELNKIRFKV